MTAGAASGHGWGYFLDHFVVTNAFIGASLAAGGLADRAGSDRETRSVGCCWPAGSVTPARRRRSRCSPGVPTPVMLRPFWRLVGTWANVSWPWAIAGLLPMALLLFPDGRFVSRRWRWVLVPAVVGTSLFAASGVVRHGQPGRRPRGPVLPDLARVRHGGLGRRSHRCAERLVFAAARGVVGDPVLARRRPDPSPVAVVAAGRRRTRSSRSRFPTWWGSRRRLSLFAVCLVPLSITVAVLRYQLLDIRLVVSRFVLYLLLSGLVITAYLGLVACSSASSGSRWSTRAVRSMGRSWSSLVSPLRSTPPAGGCSAASIASSTAHATIRSRRWRRSASTSAIWT